MQKIRGHEWERLLRQTDSALKNIWRSSVKSLQMHARTHACTCTLTNVVHVQLHTRSSHNWHFKVARAFFFFFSVRPFCARRANLRSCSRSCWRVLLEARKNLRQRLYVVLAGVTISEDNNPAESRTPSKKRVALPRLSFVHLLLLLACRAWNVSFASAFSNNLGNN